MRNSIIREWELLDEKSVNLLTLSLPLIYMRGLFAERDTAVGLCVGVRTQPEIVPFPQTGDGRKSSLGD